jgi:bifunctional aspartokinase / homoserine dehydrogenase 1
MNRIEDTNNKAHVMNPESLQVMKFGGTSVGNASCIRTVAEVIRTASLKHRIVVVVSAMSGVTNRLIEAANESKAGNEKIVGKIFAQLKEQHNEVVQTLIHSHGQQQHLERELRNLFAEGERLCEGTNLLRELTPQTLDAISGLGERLCAPLVAAALVELGVDGEAIDATALVVTDSYHGRAEPRIDLTRTRCQAHLVPLLREGIVPVVTGFIGATEEGILTTLGRGGSDYSATILGAALDADEVVIWSDVSGILTADPRLVAEACPIAEISYREAAELAYFGAKVLHPKTLRPLMQRGIPIWIKNTFAADEPGTRVTPTGPRNSRTVTALTAIRDATLVTIAGRGTPFLPDALARTVATAAAVRTDILMISQSSLHNDICLVIPGPIANRIVEALRREFSSDLKHEKVENAVYGVPVSVITMVSNCMRTVSGTVTRALATLGEENVSIIATAVGSSDCSLSFAVSQPDMEAALTNLHRKLELGSLPLNEGVVRQVGNPSLVWKYQSEQAGAD